MEEAMTELESVTTIATAVIGAISGAGLEWLRTRGKREEAERVRRDLAEVRTRESTLRGQLEESRVQAAKLGSDSRHAQKEIGRLENEIVKLERELTPAQKRVRVTGFFDDLGNPER
jgi:chromosome segregation ATPase